MATPAGFGLARDPGAGRSRGGAMSAPKPTLVLLVLAVGIVMIPAAQSSEVNCSHPGEGRAAQASEVNSSHSSEVRAAQMSEVNISKSSEVRVVDDAGKPVVDAMVACLGRETGAAVTGEDGTAIVPGACKEVYCERGDLVPDKAIVEEGKAACRLRAGLILSVEIVPKQPDELYYVSAYDPRNRGGLEAGITGGVPRTADGGSFVERDEQGKRRHRLRPLLAGRYRLEVGRHRDQWQCGTDLGELPAGQHNVTVVWREPVEVKGRVLDRQGNPVADVPLFVRPEEQDAASPAGGWTCIARQEGREPVTNKDGIFRVLVDPAAPVKLEAGWQGYPIGTASISIKGIPGQEPVLRLK